MSSTDTIKKLTNTIKRHETALNAEVESILSKAGLWYGNIKDLSERKNLDKNHNAALFIDDGIFDAKSNKPNKWFHTKADINAAKKLFKKLGE